MSFPSAVSLRFSVCSPYSLLLTSDRQQEHDAGDRKRREAATWWAAGMAQDHGTHRPLPRHSACQCPSHHFKRSTTDTPSSFTPGCYHSNSLFSSAVSQRTVSANHQILIQNAHFVHTLFQQYYVYSVWHCCLSTFWYIRDTVLSTLTTQNHTGPT